MEVDTLDQFDSFSQYCIIASSYLIIFPYYFVANCSRLVQGVLFFILLCYHVYNICRLIVVLYKKTSNFFFVAQKKLFKEKEKKKKEWPAKHPHQHP